MAYMSFTPWEAHGHTTRNGRNAAVDMPTAVDAGMFTPLELRVISLGERYDASRELSQESRGARLLERLFGLTLHAPLANPRLERLRRFASLAQHHPDKVAEGDVADMIAAGFAPGQVLGLLDYFSVRKAPVRKPALA